MTWNWIQELKSQAKKKVQLIHSNIGEEKYFFRGRCYWNCKQLIKIKKESQTRSIIKSTGTFIGNFYSKKQVWAWKKREERKKEEKINKDYRGIENSTEKWGGRSGPVLSCFLNGADQVILLFVLSLSRETVAQSICALKL